MTEKIDIEALRIQATAANEKLLVAARLLVEKMTQIADRAELAHRENWPDADEQIASYSTLVFHMREELEKAASFGSLLQQEAGLRVSRTEQIIDALSREHAVEKTYQQLGTNIKTLLPLSEVQILVLGDLCAQATAKLEAK
jgi:ribosomal protein L20A (L18A)